MGICESAAFFIYDGIRPLAPGYALENARAVTAYCRSRKSAAELALMQRGEEMGRFLLGSTVVLLWPHGTLRFAPDWAPGGAVRMGQALGKALG